MAEVAERSWRAWVERNRERLAAGSPYELAFAEEILPEVTGLSPDHVFVQEPFRDENGRSYRMDFAIRDGDARIAVEVDGYNKTGQALHGMSHEEFVAFLRRQTVLSGQGWMVLRFANTDFTKYPRRCVRQIELALQQAKSQTGAAPALSVDEARELERLRLETNDKAALEAQMKKKEAALRRANRQRKQAEVEAAAAQEQAMAAQREAATAAERAAATLDRARLDGEQARKRRQRLWAALVVALGVSALTTVLLVTREDVPGVRPTGTACPADHPIKGNRSQSTSERIYHVPTGRFYASTTPTRCFATEDEAVSAGYRKSKR